jgi:hypothetical protein
MKNTKETWSRRQMLGWSAAGLATIVLPRRALASETQTARAAQLGDLSIGYLEGSDEYAGPPPWATDAGAPEGAWRVVPAASLLVGEQRWAMETIVMRIHGLYPLVAPRQLAGIERVELDVEFPSFDPERQAPFPFRAWSLRRGPQEMRSASLKFVVPLREDGALPLSQRVTSEEGTETRLRAELTVDFWAGQPKLQRGFYLFGLSPGVWDAPRQLPRAGEPADLSLASLAVSFEGPSTTEQEEESA